MEMVTASIEPLDLPRLMFYGPIRTHMASKCEASLC